MSKFTKEFIAEQRALSETLSEPEGTMLIDALDEIERLNAVIAYIKHTLMIDSGEHSWKVAGINALRCIELNIEGGEG